MAQQNQETPEKEGGYLTALPEKRLWEGSSSVIRGREGKTEGWVFIRRRSHLNGFQRPWGKEKYHLQKTREKNARYVVVSDGDELQKRALSNSNPKEKRGHGHTGAYFIKSLTNTKRESNDYP